MDLFNTVEKRQQFYPTEPDLADAMVQIISEHFPKHSQLILDPSAGDGALLEAIQRRNNKLSHYSDNKWDMIACEINHERVEILRAKDFRVVGEDFFLMPNEFFIDGIIMNPPFNDAVKHILHAWEMLSPGGVLVSLINSNTLENQIRVRSGELSKLIEQYGTQENRGAAFANARRKTNVDVDIITLYKPAEESGFTMDGYEKDTLGFDKENIQQEVMRSDKVRSAVDLYNGTRAVMSDVLDQLEKLQSYMNHAMIATGETKDGMRYDVDVLSWIKTTWDGGSSKGKRMNKFTNSLKRSLWNRVFNSMGLDKYLTTQTKKDLNEMIRVQTDMGFTEANIKQIIEMIFFNQDMIAEKCIEEIFDKLTDYDAKNKVWLVDGFKTNSAYKINKKVIIPYGVEHCKFTYRIYSRQDRLFEDLDRVMCIISGKRFEDITTIYQAIKKDLDARYYSGDPIPEIESTFFHIKAHKKGTVHLTWKEKFLYEEFNRRAAALKNWLPEDVNN